MEHKQILSAWRLFFYLFRRPHSCGWSCFITTSSLSPHPIDLRKSIIAWIFFTSFRKGCVGLYSVRPCLTVSYLSYPLGAVPGDHWYCFRLARGGHCPLPDVRLTFTTFRQLAVLLPSVDWLLSFICCYIFKDKQRGRSWNLLNAELVHWPLKNRVAQKWLLCLLQLWYMFIYFVSDWNHKELTCRHGRHMTFYVVSISTAFIVTTSKLKKNTNSLTPRLHT